MFRGGRDAVPTRAPTLGLALDLVSLAQGGIPRRRPGHRHRRSFEHDMRDLSLMGFAGSSCDNHEGTCGARMLPMVPHGPLHIVDTRRPSPTLLLYIHPPRLENDGMCARRGRLQQVC